MPRLCCSDKLKVKIVYLHFAPALWLWFPALPVFVFSPSYFHLSLLVCVPFLSSSSCFYPPFFFIHVNKLNPALFYSLICSVHLPIRRFTHHITAQSTYLRASRPVLWDNFSILCTMPYKILCIWQVAELMSVFIAESKQGTSCGFWYVIFEPLFLFVCVRLGVHLLLEVGCHVLSETTYMSVLAWCQSTCAPPLFSCRVRQCRWEVQEGEKKKHR